MTSPKKKDETPDFFTNQALEAITSKLRSIENHIEMLQSQTSKVEPAKSQIVESPVSMAKPNDTQDRLQELEIKINELLNQSTKPVAAQNNQSQDPDWEVFNKVNISSPIANDHR
jgi:hypothetical protein